MDRPRVLYLSSWPIGAHGEGPASFVYEQIAALAEFVQASYVEHRFTDALHWARKRASRADVERIADLWPHGVSAVRIITPRLPPRLTGHELLEDIWRAGSMVAARVVRSLGEFDLVHAHVVLPIGLLSAAIAETLRIPLVLQEHSGPFSMHTDSPEKRDAVRRTMTSARYACAVGEALAAEIANVCDGRVDIHVVPNLIRTRLFYARPMPNERSEIRIITVGSPEAGKGLDTLLSAVRSVQDRGHRVRLRLVGIAEAAPPLVRALAGCGLDPESVLMGKVTRQQVADAIADAHIYVCASRSETFGIAPAEALAVGRPVVTTRCGGPEAFVDSTCGEVVAPNDALAMADAILSTWQRIDEFDPVRLHKVVDARFGHDAFCHRMLAVYRDAIGERAAA